MKEADFAKLARRLTAVEDIQNGLTGPFSWISDYVKLCTQINEARRSLVYALAGQAPREFADPENADPEHAVRKAEQMLAALSA